MRDYVVRGLLHPARRTPVGHSLYDEQALTRLLLVRALFEAGIGLDELARLCHALNTDGDANECLSRLRMELEARRQRLESLDQQIAGMMDARTESYYG